MDFFNVISVDEARRKIKETFLNSELDIEEIEILDALDRILAENIVSTIDVPGFNRSTVDGYAVKSQNSHGASETLPSFLNLIGETIMGENTNLTILDGEAVYVPTGGIVPEGADAVIMIEHVEQLGDNLIALYKPVAYKENMLFQGDDVGEGEVILEKGKKIRPQDIGVLAAIGMATLKVYKKPRFFILSTGDEIIDLHEPLDKGKIRDINGYALYALIKKLGGDVVRRVIVKDDFEKLKCELSQALDSADIIIISGGSSVGTKDYTYELMNTLTGQGVFIHGLSIKPGKPTLVGEAHGKPVFGLPGHPVSSIIVFKAIVEYFIKNKMEIKEDIIKTKAILDFNIHSSPGQETYQMVSLVEKDGHLHAVPVLGKSGMITLLSNSNGYIVMKAHEEGLYQGEEREVYFI
jgi:molybdopterin molybdotransferase